MGDDAEREILLTRMRALLNDPTALRIMDALVALGSLGDEARDELRRAEGLDLARHGAALWEVRQARLVSVVSAGAGNWKATPTALGQVALAWMDAAEDATPPTPSR